MTCRAGLYISFTGLMTAVLGGPPALLLLTCFGWGNLFVTVDDTVVTLLAAASHGPAALGVGLALTRRKEEQAVATTYSLACLAAAGLWLLLCLALAASSYDQYIPGLAWSLAARGAAIGTCALSALGFALGLAALGGGRRGMAALALNALALLGAGVSLLASYGTPH